MAPKQGLHAESAAVDLVTTLRGQGVSVSPAQTVTFVEALQLLGSPDLMQVYRAGRAILATDVDVYPQYFAAFVQCFLAQAVPPQPPAAQPPPAVQVQTVERLGSPSDEQERHSESPDPAPVNSSDHDRLRSTSFADLNPEELRRALALIDRLRLVRLESRQGRRRVRSASGSFLDMRGTIRRSLASDGEPVRLAARSRRRRPRPVIFVIDISASMSPFALAWLRFGHALRRAGHPVRVYTAAVRLTEITDSLRATSPDRALAQASTLMTDWDGGTRLATSLAQLTTTEQQCAQVRGSNLVICSDGLDHDTPEALGRTMQQLALLGHRVVWLNPLAADPRFEPRARGIVAALPHIDTLLSGHSVEALELTARVLRGPLAVGLGGAAASVPEVRRHA